MAEIEKYIGRRLDGGNVIPVLNMGVHPDAVGSEYILNGGFDLTSPRVHKFGANPSIDAGSVPEDIWDGSGVYPGFIAGVQACEVLSSDGADDGSPAGAGAHTIEIQGCDAALAFQSVTVTLNGATPVAIGNFSRIFRAIIRTAGNPTNSNVGTITVRTVAGPITMGQILPDIGQTLMAIYTVPSNYSKAWLVQISASLRADNAQARAATVAFQWRPFSGAWNTKEYTEIHSYGGLAVLPYPLPVEVESRTDMRMRVLSVSTASTFINAAFDLKLVPQ